MFNTQKLPFHYFLTAPIDGGTSELNLTTGYPSDTNVNTYIITDDDDTQIHERISIYETGLVTYIHQTSNNIVLKTNKEFHLQDNGVFMLCE